MASDPGFGRKIHNARVALNITQADLAKKLNVSPQAVWNWEMNGARPRAATLSALASALHLEDIYLRSSDARVPGAVRTVPQIIRAAREEIAALLGLETDRIIVEWRLDTETPGQSPP